MDGEKKLVRLVAEQPFYNYVDVKICDFGGPGGQLRQRGRISVDYGPADIRQLKEKGIDTLEAALAYYREDIEKTVRRYLLTDFVLEDGAWEALLSTVAEHLREHFPAQNPEAAKGASGHGAV